MCPACGLLNPKTHNGKEIFASSERLERRRRFRHARVRVRYSRNRRPESLRSIKERRASRRARRLARAERRAKPAAVVSEKSTG
jgi:hypothetical protein